MDLDSNHHACRTPPHQVPQRLFPIEDIFSDVRPLDTLAFKTYTNYSNNHTNLGSCGLESTLLCMELLRLSIFQTSLAYHGAEARRS